MSTIRKLISAWVLTLIGSLLLPLMSMAAVSGATCDAAYVSMTTPATVAKHTVAVGKVDHSEVSLQSMASGRVRSLLGRSQILDAPKISPRDINFSQRTVSGNVQQYVRDMKAGNWDWNTSGPIRIMKQNGKWVSYDNRRLMAAQQAGLKDIPYKVVDPKAIMPGSKKTWAQAFQKRFGDMRNVDAGGVVPAGGLSTQPGIAQ